jgi:DNA-binding Lrp family transcriptional regulator
MPLELDHYDVSILKSLLKDGRKSFREISRETGITTPTVKARFSRLVNIGFIKSVSPILDFNIAELDEKVTVLKGNNKKKKNQGEKQNNVQNADSNIKKGLKIKLYCAYCKGLILGKPQVLTFANFERFFCCRACISDYKNKYAGRIESIKRKFKGENEY